MSVSGGHDNIKKRWHWLRNRPHLTPVHVYVSDAKFGGDRAQCEAVARAAKVIFEGLPIEADGDAVKTAIQEKISEMWSDCLRREGRSATCPLLFRPSGTLRFFPHSANPKQTQTLNLKPYGVLKAESVGIPMVLHAQGEFCKDPKVIVALVW